MHQQLYETLVTVRVKVPASSLESAEARATAALSIALDRHRRIAGYQWEIYDGPHTQVADITEQWPYMVNSA